MNRIFGLLFFLVMLTAPWAGESILSQPKSVTAQDTALTVKSQGFTSVGFQLSGTWSGTVKFEGTINGSAWATLVGVTQKGRSVDSTATANGIWTVAAAGLKNVRARVTAYDSGTVVITAMMTEGTGVVGLQNPGAGGGGAASTVEVTQIDAGDNNIGNVDVASSVLPTGAATAAKQPALGTAGSSSADVLSVQGIASGTAMPVSAAALPLPSGAATAAKQPALGTAGSASTDVITVQGIASGVAQPVSYGTTGSGTSTNAIRVELPTNGTGVIGTVAAVTAITNALPAGTNAIGKLSANSGVNIGDVNPATAANWGTGATGAAAPANAQYAGAVSSGNLTGIIQADASAKIDVSTATTTQLVALSSSKKIYVTSWDVVAAGTGTIKLVYGTGSSCGTGTTDLTGAYSLVAQSGLAKGNGLGPVIIVPASNALCVTTSAAVGMQGSVSYTQF